MFNVVLVEPEIPPNTGNVIRLCANTGAALHLVEPLGFTLDDAKMRRAGLDYHEFARVQVHSDFASIERAGFEWERAFAFTTHGTTPFKAHRFQAGDWFVFGAETRGLDPALRERFAADRRLRLPMIPGNRSLNLSNAVAVVVFEAWRQHDYAGGA